MKYYENIFIMNNELLKLKPFSEFFIGIDSDGCVFDTMELKHKECFCPNFIKYWDLQPVSKYAREVWDYVNLYSKSRGINRFLALIEALDRTYEKCDKMQREIKKIDIAPLRTWTEKETSLGNKSLEKYLSENENKVLEKALKWSYAINKDVQDMVYGMTPFPFVKEILKEASSKSDIVVVSQTPLEALAREWEENDMDGFINFIAAQEHGTKKEHIEIIAKGKYKPNHMLMIGDAPGDLKAAKENGALFYPIIPGDEEESWNRLYLEGLQKFFTEDFEGTYEKRLIEAFDKQLSA